MFQDFSDTNTKHACAERVKKLRAIFSDYGVDGFIVPREDAYQGEYVPACNERLQWLTGFSGSAGLAFIFADKAALCVDGRYTLQASSQTDTSLFEIVHTSTIRPISWLAQHIHPKMRLGIDPTLHTVNAYHQFDKTVTKAGGLLVDVSRNLIDDIWVDRPEQPQVAVRCQPLVHAGLSAKQKCDMISTELKAENIDAFIISQPEDIAWLLNIRGSDVPHTPFALSYAVIDKHADVIWFIDSQRVAPDVMASIGDHVTCRDPLDLASEFATYSGRTIGIDPSTTPMRIAQLLENSPICHVANPISLPKAKKNTSEVNGARAAHLRDGIALTRFLYWIDQKNNQNNLTEIDAAKKLEQLRSETNALLDLSFDTISGSGPNGAIVHYRVNETTNRKFQNGDIYLVDSGGQYQDGTTDVTRTILIGDTPPLDAITCFTRVLRGHIALAAARFPVGTTGGQLDILARAPLWQVGLDFDHGTGHGVGSYLSVHEGPQRISKGGDVPLEAGMIVSNEPGYYRAGAFGIRIENLQVVTPAIQDENMERPMHCFETLTLAPIDRRLIDANLMNAEEISWLNQYHQRVLNEVGPALNKQEHAWLISACAPIA